MYQTDDRTALSHLRSEIQPKTEVACRNCGKSIKLYNENEACFVSCSHCQTLINLEENHKEIQIFIPKLPAVPITIGSLCTFKSIPYKVIGYSILKEKREKDSYWTEYVLIDSNGNFKILTNDQNHFNLFDYEPISEKEIKKVKNYRNKLQVIEYAGETFHLIFRSEPVWQCSFGEIPYDPQNSCMCFEYVCQEKIICRQKINPAGNDEYSIGEYMNRWEMKRAFGKRFGKPAIISGNRVPVKGLTSKMIFVAFLTFVAAASILSIIKDFLLPEEILLQNEYMITPEMKLDSLIISQSFELNNGPSLLALELNTPSLQDSWLVSFVSLVNEETNTQQAFEIYTSYYSGIEEGEKWTEGSTRSYAYLDQVKDGRYHLTYQFDKLESKNVTTAYFVLSKNPGIWKNFWLLTIIALLFPLVYWLLERYYNAQKEMNSNSLPTDL